MDSLQRVKINEIAESEFEENTLAQGVIALVDDTVFFRIPEAIPDSSGKWDGEQPSPTEQQQTSNSSVKDIMLYPNPFENSFNISYLLEREASELKVEIYDVVGKNVKTQLFKNTQTGNINIDLGQCLGIYFVRISSDNEVIFKDKVVCLNH